MEELKQKLIDDCNASGLPLEAILFVTRDLWRDVDDTIRRAKEEQKALQQAPKTIETEGE